MKRLKWYIACAVLTIGMSASAQQNETRIQENTVHALKVKELNLRKANLQKQIKIEDQKRNRTMNGVAAGTQELLNDKQDSICLELRSQLVSVELELKELVPDKTGAIIANRLNSLNQK